MRNVDAKTLKQWLDRGEAVLVDVREPAEHRAEHIGGAALVPLSSARLAALPEHEGRKLVVHCLKGGRGAKACELLLAEDPALDVYNLEGGLGAWRDAGYAVNSSGRFFLPLDRQVQLTVGLGVLAGSLVAWLVSPAFLLLTGFFGAGLCFAGLSGFCGMARLLAAMPWNRAA